MKLIKFFAGLLSVFLLSSVAFAQFPSNVDYVLSDGTGVWAIVGNDTNQLPCVSPAGTTNDFTNSVTLVAPPDGGDNGLQAATEDFVRNAVAATALQLYFYTNVSTDVATYLQLSTDESPQTTHTLSYTNVTNDQWLVSFITEAGVPGIDAFLTGIYQLNMHIQNPSPAGDKDVAVKLIVLHRGGTTETGISTTEVSPIATAADVHFERHFSVLEDIELFITNRIVARIVAVVTGNGNAPEIDLLIEGDTASHFGIGISAGEFVNKHGDFTQMTGLGGTTGQVFKTRGDNGEGYWEAVPIIEKYLDNKQQTFTAAAAFVLITNFTTSVSAESWTSTHTNITVGISGNYFVSISVSLASGTVNTFTDGHLFTNGTEVSRIGWTRETSGANEQGSATGGGLIYLAAGVSVTLRVDVDKDVTLDFDHLSLILIKQ